MKTSKSHSEIIWPLTRSFWSGPSEQVHLAKSKQSWMRNVFWDIVYCVFPWWGPNYTSVAWDLFLFLSHSYRIGGGSPEICDFHLPFWPIVCSAVHMFLSEKGCREAEGGTVCWMGFYADISWESRCSSEIKVWVIFLSNFVSFWSPFLTPSQNDVWK